MLIMMLASNPVTIKIPYIRLNVFLSVSHCKERWRNLRACLTRHLKNNQRQSGYHKPYYLAEHMKFLLPYTRTRSPKSADPQKQEFVDYISNVKKQRQSDDENDNFDEDDNDDKDHDYQDDADEEIGDRNSYEDDQTSNEFLVERKTAAPNVTIPISIPIEAFALHPSAAGSSSVNGEIVMIESKPRAAGQSNSVKRKTVDNETVDSYQTEPKRFEISPVDAKEIEDADINFFKSLLPDIRLLNASQKRRFKMGILELIDNICEKQ